MSKDACKNKKSIYLCTRNTVVIPHANGLVAQLNSASDYGSEGYRFESCRGHESPTEMLDFFIA